MPELALYQSSTCFADPRMMKRAVGAALVSPALQRGESDPQKNASPVGTVPSS